MCAEWGVGQGGIWEHRLKKEQKESREEHSLSERQSRENSVSNQTERNEIIHKTER